MSEPARRLEWIGAALGMSGAALLALNVSISPWGWVLFALSNLCWIGFARASGLRGLSLQHCLFLGTSLLGCARYLI